MISVYADIVLQKYQTLKTALKIENNAPAAVKEVSTAATSKRDRIQVNFNISYNQKNVFADFKGVMSFLKSFEKLWWQICDELEDNVNTALIFQFAFSKRTQNISFLMPTCGTTREFAIYTNYSRLIV